MVSEKGEGHIKAERIERFLVLLFIGFFIILFGIMVLIIATVLSGGGAVSIGGFVLIGPFPIVFGAGPEATWLVLFAIILGILSIIMFFILQKKLRKVDFELGCFLFLSAINYIQKYQN